MKLRPTAENEEYRGCHGLLFSITRGLPGALGKANELGHVVGKVGMCEATSRVGVGSARMTQQALNGMIGTAYLHSIILLNFIIYRVKSEGPARYILSLIHISFIAGRFRAITFLQNNSNCTHE